MIIQGIQDVKTKKELREHILEHGLYSHEENLRIYEKWFANGPRYLFRAVDKKYGISNKPLCDVGCAYGMNLVYCHPGSYGIEIQEYEVKFAYGIGLKVYQKNLITDDISDLPNVEAAWCSAVLEHVDTPHIFLRKLHSLLKTDGVLALYVPTIPICPQLRHLPKFGKYFCGHTADDHINAYSPKTIRFFCERAGFKTLEISHFYPNLFSIFNKIPFIDGCVYIGGKIDNWQYPERATRKKK